MLGSSFFMAFTIFHQLALAVIVRSDHKSPHPAAARLLAHQAQLLKTFHRDATDMMAQIHLLLLVLQCIQHERGRSVTSRGQAFTWPPGQCHDAARLCCCDDVVKLNRQVSA
jgi:hypothetical protein